MILLQEVISFAIEAGAICRDDVSPDQEASQTATVILNYNTISHVKLFRLVDAPRGAVLPWF